MFHQLHNIIKIETSGYTFLFHCRPTYHNDCHTLAEHSSNTKCFKYSFFSLTIKDWNLLKRTLTTESSINLFTAAIDSELLAS